MVWNDDCLEGLFLKYRWAIQSSPFQAIKYIWIFVQEYIEESSGTFHWEQP